MSEIDTSSPWELRRGQYIMNVVARCPRCGTMVGEWPEAGMVRPSGIYWGSFICECGWKPENKPKIGA